MVGRWDEPVGNVEQMRFAHVFAPDSTGPSLAIVRGQAAVFAADLSEPAPVLLQDLIERGPEALAALDALADAAPDSVWHSLDSLSFAPAVLNPPNVLAIGANYAAHSDELELNTGSAMTVFGLWTNSLAGHHGTTSWDPKRAAEVDYEAELGVVIGRDAKNVSVAKALDYVFGYTAVNDITSRAVQFREPQWSRAKSFDGFTPVGPVVVTADEIGDPQQLRIRCDVNGVRLQDGPTSDMVRSVAEIISELSKSATLKAGTLISTGSPGGAGYSRSPQVFLTDGSVVTVSIDKIGELTTTCHVE